MSISRRIATLFRVKANKALDRAEDPREMLDYSAAALDEGGDYRLAGG